MRSAQAIERILAFARDKDLFNKGSRLLLAVSGGKDSMAMLHLFRDMPGLEISVAHMNFGLRGDESDADAAFVKSTCESLGIDCYIAETDCRTFAAENRLSTQQAARTLRYDWFESMAAEYNFDKICTAHHLDDSLETVLINLIRGTGLEGLKGIPVSRDNIVRPMLCLTSEEIGRLVETEQISYREDASNQSNKYLRNRIRHELIPLLGTLTESGTAGLFASLDLLSSQWEAVEQIIQSLTPKFASEVGDTTTVDLDALMRLPGQVFLFERLSRRFGFSPTQAHDLLDARTGASTLSPTHRMSRDRNQILITPIAEFHTVARRVVPGVQVDLPGGVLKVDIRDEAPSFNSDPMLQIFDADQIEGSLTIRNWQEGDRIQPLGMQGSQKLSDILINRKVSMQDKRGIYVLCDESKMLWVIGLVMSDLVKVTEKTRRYAHASWTPA